MKFKSWTLSSLSLGKYIQKLLQHVQKSIRIQLVLTFSCCLLLASLIGFVSSTEFVTKERKLDFTSGQVTIDENARGLVRQFNQMNQDINGLVKELGMEDPIFRQKFLDRPLPLSKGNGEWLSIPSEGKSVYHLTKNELIQYVIDVPKQKNNLKVLVTDLDGKVLYHSAGSKDTQVNLHHIIENATMIHIAQQHDEHPILSSFYPISLSGPKAFLIVSGSPKPTVIYVNEPGITPYVLAVITFILCFYYITKRKMKEIEGIASGLMEIAKGNLKHRIQEKSNDELGSLASNINYMAQELDQMMERQRETEKLKDELITNVSHDLRTPLTSIMGYMRLVKDHQYQSQTQLDEYVDIAYGKSEQLKTLVEALFDFTRLNHKGIQLKMEQVCLNQMLDQLMEELVPAAQGNNVTFCKDFPAERIMIKVSPNHMVRVFENILMNAIKYSLHPGTIRVKLKKSEGAARIIVSNATSEPLSKEAVKRLFERFYRVDSSRSSSKGGTGLGLAITKSIIELHHGSIDVEYDEPEITFVITLPLGSGTQKEGNKELSRFLFPHDRVQ